ncbi:MAG TPA: restriction endonuclease subunit S [Solirubrobacterales bacterium]
MSTTVARVGRVRVGRQRSPQHVGGRFPTPYLRAANITAGGIDLDDVQEMDFTPEERSVYALVEGDVVLTEASGSESQVGRPAIWGEELPLCCFQNTVIRVRPHAVVPGYALLVFRQHMASGVFADTARGIGIQHLGAARLADLPFPLPPLAEQERIAAEATRRLDELRAAREALETALARTREQDSEILAAAASGRLAENPSAEGEATGDSIFPDLPPGWEIARVDEVADVRLGKQRSPQSHSGSDMRPYLRVANVFEDRIDLTDVKEMNFTPEEYERYALKAGDILLNEGQSPELVGRPAIYRDELPGACFQNTLVRFRAGPRVDPGFALLVFRHYLHSGEFRRVSRGSTNIAHLSRTRFAAMPFPLPPLEEQAAIAARAELLLAESSERRETISLSLEGIETVEREILAAAASGALVPQEEGDEPAEELLERVGEPPPDRVDIDSELMEETGMSADQEPVREGEPLLAGVLRRSGPLDIPGLCRAAKFDLNDIDDIERFYLALRDELGESVEAVGEPEENQTLRAVADAT